MISRINSYFVAVAAVIIGVTMLPSKDSTSNRILDVAGELFLTAFMLIAVPYIIVREK